MKDAGNASFAKSLPSPGNRNLHPYRPRPVMLAWAKARADLAKTNVNGGAIAIERLRWATPARPTLFAV